MLNWKYEQTRSKLKDLFVYKKYDLRGEKPFSDALNSASSFCSPFHCPKLTRFGHRMQQNCPSVCRGAICQWEVLGNIWSCRDPSGRASCPVSSQQPCPCRMAVKLFTVLLLEGWISLLVPDRAFQATVLVFKQSVMIQSFFIEKSTKQRTEI